MAHLGELKSQSNKQDLHKTCTVYFILNLTLQISQEHWALFVIPNSTKWHARNRLEAQKILSEHALSEHSNFFPKENNMDTSEHKSAILRVSLTRKFHSKFF